VLSRLLDVVLKMEKSEKRAAIKYLLHMRGLSTHQIHLDMKEVLGDDAPSQATVY